MHEGYEVLHGPARVNDKNTLHILVVIKRYVLSCNCCHNPYGGAYLFQRDVNKKRVGVNL